ncbi:MAG: two-component regulator propeller domain-containing protein, partial [bacterium]
MIGKTISHYNILRRTMVLLLLAASVAFPQNQKPKFERISIEQGLSQSGITSIFQDSRGLLWFGTNAGLNKYDGYRFTVYKHSPNAPNSLSTNEVGTTVEDERGALWISTWGGGLNRFDPETEAFTHWKHDPDDPTSLSDDYITDIHLDSCHDGVLWIATEYGGLNRFDPETGQFTRLMPKWVIDREATHGTTEKFIMPIHEDAGGDLWMGIGGGGLNRFNRDTETFDRWMPEAGNPESISFEFVEFICEDPHGDDGVLWVATHGGGLNRFDIESETFTRWRHEPGNPNSLSSDYIFSLYADTFAGGLWIGTDGGGLNRFDIKADTFSHWRNDPDDPNSLSDNKITNIHEDRTGALWIGTLGGGICKLNRNERQQNRFFHRQHDPDDPRSLSQNNVSAIYEDKAGAIWVGTYGGGLNRFDSQTGTFEFWLSTPKDTIGSGMNIFYPQANNIIAIHEDYHGILWIGTYGGKLFQFDRETERFVYWPFGQNFLNHIFTKYILSFYENAADSGRILWLGTRANYGLAKMIRNDEGSGDFLHWGSETENPDAINSNDVFCIYGDESGRLWLGTGGGGVNIFDPKTEKFTHLLNEPGNPNSLGSNVVNCIYTSPADSGAILWLGTEAGLNKLVLEDRNPETARFFHFKEKDGLPNDYICGILADDRGNLWLSTLNGLSRFDPKTETFRNYDAHDGLQGGEFTRGAAFKTRSGEMYFGGTNGLNSFHPDSLRDNPHIPPILITDFQILNEPIEISPNGETPLLKHVFATNEIVLSHRDNVFSFEFAALDYNAPQKNQYAYMMEGFDEDWIYSGSRRFVTYTNLDPGKYVFRVKGSNNDGVWNEEGTFVRIIITPPWWQTWWAYALYTVLIALALYGARRFEIARVHLRNELRL